MRLAKWRRASSTTWGCAVERSAWAWWTISSLAIGCGRSWDAATTIHGWAPSRRAATGRRTVRISWGWWATLGVAIDIGSGGRRWRWRAITLIVPIVVIAVVALVLVVLLIVLLRRRRLTSGVLALGRRSRLRRSVTSLVRHVRGSLYRPRIAVLSLAVRSQLPSRTDSKRPNGGGYVDKSFEWRRIGY